MFDRHILFTGCSSAAFIVVEQISRFRESGIVEYTQMAGSRHPVAVRSFLMIHHAERFVLVATFEEFNGFISNNIRGVSFFYNMLPVFPKIRIVIVTLFVLAAKDAPMIESLRFTDKMPFTNYCSLISGLLKQFGECLLVSVERTGVIGKTILVAELTGEDART